MIIDYLFSGSSCNANDLVVENLDNLEEEQPQPSNNTHKNNDSGIENNSFVKHETNRSCCNQLDGFSPHTISTPVNDCKSEEKITKDNTYPEQQKLDLKNIEDAVAKIDIAADENCNDNRPKTSDYDSLSNSIVDNLLNKLSQDSELCTSQKTDNTIQEPKLSSFKKADISDLVFEDCKKTIDEKDKGNVSKISPGQYYGQARHKDGSILPIIFEVG